MPDNRTLKSLAVAVSRSAGSLPMALGSNSAM
jgi:hypothetical protein